MKRILMTVAVAMAILSSARGSVAGEYREDGFATPNVNNARFDKSIIKDVLDILDIYKGKETILKVYVNANGTFFNTLEYKGKLYGFFVDVDGKLPLEYALIDQNGDGIFRHKYGTYESWPDPPWMYER